MGRRCAERSLVAYRRSAAGSLRCAAAAVAVRRRALRRGEKPRVPRASEAGLRDAERTPAPLLCDSFDEGKRYDLTANVDRDALHRAQLGLECEEALDPLCALGRKKREKRI